LKQFPEESIFVEPKNNSRLSISCRAEKGCGGSVRLSFCKIKLLSAPPAIPVVPEIISADRCQHFFSGDEPEPWQAYAYPQSLEGIDVVVVSSIGIGI
jgi:hypothetical protein